MAKRKIFYISDDQFFFPNATPLEMKKFYENFYPDFDSDRYFILMSKFINCSVP